MMRLTFCTDFVQFVNCVLQKTYKGSLSQLVVQVLYSFHIVCMYIQKTQVHRQFHLATQLQLCMVCKLHCLYLQKTYISSFKLFSVCTLYKFCSYSLQLATFLYVASYVGICDVYTFLVANQLASNIQQGVSYEILIGTSLYTICVIFVQLHFVQFLQVRFF